MTSKKLPPAEPRDWKSHLKVTSIKEESFTFNWTIHGYGKYVEKLREEDADKPFEFSSPVFSHPLPSGQSKWRLAVFSKTDDFSDEMWFRLRKSSDDDESYSVSYQVGTLVTDGSYAMTNKKRKVFRKGTDEDEVFVHSVIGMQYVLPPDGNLTISCNIELAMCEDTTPY